MHRFTTTDRAAIAALANPQAFAPTFGETEDGQEWPVLSRPEGGEPVFSVEPQAGGYRLYPVWAQDEARDAASLSEVMAGLNEWIAEAA